MFLLELKLDQTSFKVMHSDLDGKIEQSLVDERVQTLNDNVIPLFPHHQIYKYMVIMIPSIISLIYIIIELFPRGASTSPSLDSTSCLQGITDCINSVTDTNTAAAGGARNNNTLMNVRNAAIGGVAVSFLFHLVIWKRNTLELAKAEAALISTLQKFNLDEELEGITWSYEKKADGSRVFKHFVRLSACTGAEDSMYWAGKSLATIASHDTDTGADATRLDINAQDESALRDLILEKKNSSAVHL